MKKRKLRTKRIKKQKTTKKTYKIKRINLIGEVEIMEYSINTNIHHKINYKKYILY